MRLLYVPPKRHNGRAQNEKKIKKSVCTKANVVIWWNCNLFMLALVKVFIDLFFLLHRFGGKKRNIESGEEMTRLLETELFLLQCTMLSELWSVKFMLS